MRKVGKPQDREHQRDPKRANGKLRAIREAGDKDEVQEGHKGV